MPGGARGRGGGWAGARASPSHRADDDRRNLVYDQEVFPCEAFAILFPTFRSNTAPMVNVFVAVTDWDWFTYLRSQPDIEEVNFWQPGGKAGFQALQPGELFAFKLHAPRNYIAGGGVFYRAMNLPLSVAWDMFGIKNGAPSFDLMRERIGRYRRDTRLRMDYHIGCRILLQPFFLPEELWIPVPASWAPQIVSGRRYSTTESEGSALWGALAERMSMATANGFYEPSARYGAPQLILPRLGQGAFRVAVTDAYGRRCAVTGERTLPVLEASHIRPYSKGGSHEIQNGILMRRDVHTLFDLGYVTITKDYRFEVSKRIKEEYHNGRLYYKMAGQYLLVPENEEMKPSKNFIEWHNEEVYLP